MSNKLNQMVRKTKVGKLDLAMLSVGFSAVHDGRGVVGLRLCGSEGT